MGNKQAPPPPPSQEEEDLACLRLEYRLSDIEVKTLHAAMSRMTSTSSSSHLDMVDSFFKPVLPVNLESIFLASFLPIPTQPSLYYYLSKLCHLYSLILRPAFVPFPSKTRDRTILEALFTHAVGDGDDADERLPLVFFSFWGDVVKSQLTKSFHSFQSSTSSKPSDTPLSTFLNFVETTLPTLHLTVLPFFSMPLFQSNPPSPPPSLPPLHVLLRLHFNDSYDPDWSILFDSDNDGSSFHRYCAKLEGYDQPTLTVVELNRGIDIGVYSTSCYKESASFESSASPSFIFTTYPHFTVYRLRERTKEPHHQYLNPSSRSKDRDNLPHGVGWGGFTSQGEGGFRIFLPEKEFMVPRCSQGSTNDCRTFLPGPLLPVKCMGVGDAVRIRVYGTKNISLGLASVRAEARRRNDNVAKARKVDRAAFLDDFKSGVIESKAFTHVNQVDRGRAGDDKS